MQQILADFRAPWSRSLRFATGIATSLLLAIVLFGITQAAGVFRINPLSPFGVGPALITIAGPLAVLAGSALFAVRGYRLTPTSLIILRAGWTTSLPLGGLKKVEGVANAFKGSIRLFGNGGLFVLAGWFWNRRLGRFRAYATDPSRAVVLHFENRKIVVTPHDPQHFILRIRTLLNTRDYPG